MLPNEFPPHGVVQHHFYEWRNNGLFEKMQKKLHAMLRKKQGRKEEPSLAIIDSQSVKTGQKGGSVAMMLERKSKVGNAISPSILQGI
jgi:putative transposase